jgi:hypothetical protein
VHEKCVIKKSGWLYHTKTFGSQCKNGFLKVFKNIQRRGRSFGSVQGVNFD